SSPSLFTRKTICGENPSATYGDRAPSMKGATATAKTLSADTLEPADVVADRVPTGSSSNMTPSRLGPVGGASGSACWTAMDGSADGASELGGEVPEAGALFGAGCASASRTNP